MSIAQQTHVQKIILHTLLENDGVQSLTQGRVFGGHLKDAETPSVLAEGPILIVRMQTGLSLYSGALINSGFELWGYSVKSADEAWDVYHAGYEALQAARVSCPGIDLCGNTRELQRPENNLNQKYNAWFSRGRWLVTAA